MVGLSLCTAWQESSEQSLFVKCRIRHIIFERDLPIDDRGFDHTVVAIGFTPIVNSPEVAITGVSKATMKPVWDGTEFLPPLMLPLSLSYDHSVIDQALAARFTVAPTKFISDLRKWAHEHAFAIGSAKSCLLLADCIQVSFGLRMARICTLFALRP